eukprot:987635-Pelagomonas_calceolata.AAC.1
MPCEWGFAKKSARQARPASFQRVQCILLIHGNRSPDKVKCIIHNLIDKHHLLEHLHKLSSKLLFCITILCITLYITTDLFTKATTFMQSLLMWQDSERLPYALCAPVGKFLMDGRRYLYSASSPYSRAAGTTMLSRKNASVECVSCGARMALQGTSYVYTSCRQTVGYNSQLKVPILRYRQGIGTRLSVLKKICAPPPPFVHKGLRGWPPYRLHATVQ